MTKEFYSQILPVLIANTLFLSAILVSAMNANIPYKNSYSPKLFHDNVDLTTLQNKWKFSEEKKIPEVTASFPTSEISVVATSIGFKNFAVVYAAGKRRLAKEGDMIDGVKVLRIKKDSVEFLAGSSKRVVKLGYTPSSNQPPLQNLPPLDTVIPSQKGVNTIPKSELERLTADPGIMFTQIRLIPFVEEGRTRGFRFDWIAEGSLFHRMGIGVGDVLVSINNQPINSGEDAFRILQIIRNERSFKVDLIKNGQPVELTYTVY